MTLLVGGGWGSEAAKFRRGLLATDGFAVVDNQYLYAIITTGIVGLIALVGTTALVITTRGLVGTTGVGLAVMYFSFDLTTWPLTAFIFYLLCGLALAVGREAPYSSHAPPEKGAQQPAIEVLARGKQ